MILLLLLLLQIQWDVTNAHFCWNTTTHDGSYQERCHCNDQIECYSLSLSTNCTALPNCFSIKGSGSPNGCGWCWASSVTEGEIVGGRWGTENGPADGTCQDWTFFSNECFLHVDCGGDVKTCEGILGTYCGWCQYNKSTGIAMRGNIIGPESPNTCKGDWTWDHLTCKRSIDRPEQIRLSLAGNSGELYAVTWASYSLGTYSALRIESSEVLIHSTTSFNITANTTKFEITNTNGFNYIHRALIPSSLQPDMKYKYTVILCVETEKCTEVGPYTFVYRRTFTDINPLSILVFGDMGRVGGGQVLYALKKELAGEGTTSMTSKITDAIIHVGDFAYDLQDGDGLKGDTFLQRIEPIATTCPYMVCPGNHEIQASGNESNPKYFVHYRNRFTIPRGMGSKSVGSDPKGLDMWYSWNYGLVHFISYSSEVFFSASGETQNRMLKWIQNDLKIANTKEARMKQPWIIVFGHRPMYCSNTDGDDCTKVQSRVRSGLEETFHYGGVDIIFEAHEHSYERLFPVFNYTISETYHQNCTNDIGCVGQTHYENPSAGIHIVTGAAGCNENLGACINPIKEGRGKWSAFWLQKQGTYSYGRLTIYNASTLQWQVVIAEEERVVDDVLVTNTKGHGPRVHN